MKKGLKITLIVISSVIGIAIIGIVGLYFYFTGFGSIPSGGVLSENQSSYDVKHYYIEAEIFPESKSIRAFTDIKFLVTKNIKSFEFDLIDQLDIEKIVMDQENLSFSRVDHKTTAELNKALTPGELKQIRIYYSGLPLEANRPPWDGGFNWSKTENGDDWIGLSCQGEGAKVWMPVKDHPSDEPDSIDVRIIVDQDYFVASNGLLIDVDNIADKKRYHWKSNYTTNNYNIALNIGKYKKIEMMNRVNEDSFPIVYYTLNVDDNAKELVRKADDMLTRLSKYLGPYPFAKEKFGLVETAYLGMEHQTINSYGNEYRFHDYNGHKVDMLMLHEMAHEWFGNKITAKDWADFWIHEGMGSYVEALYLLDLVGEEAYHKHVESYDNRIMNFQSIIPHRNATTSDAYRSDIYPKGAYLMHSLRFILKDEAFFKMLYAFCTEDQFIYQNFTSTDDFIEHLSKYTDYDLSAYLQMFLYTTDLLEIEVSGHSPDYELHIVNKGFKLPIEINSDNGIEQVELSNESFSIKSSTKPIIDPKKWYLRAQVAYEED